MLMEDDESESDFVVIGSNSPYLAIQSVVLSREPPHQDGDESDPDLDLSKEMNFWRLSKR